MRIYEIAKELDISSKDVLSFLKSLKISCSSHMALVPEDVIEKVRKHFLKGLKEAKVTVKKLKKVEPREEIESKQKGEEVRGKKLEEKVEKKSLEDEDRRIVPKKSDYVGDSVPLEEVGFVEEKIGQEKISRILTRKIGLDKRTFRPRGRRRRKFKSSRGPIQTLRTVNEITVDKSLPLFEAADIMGKTSGDLVLALLKKGMVCNRNNILSVDIIKNLAEHFGINVITPQKDSIKSVAKFVTVSDALVLRWPVVVVMGHVDHGKTTLLDYIRKMNVAATEKGGITQHLGAYEVESSHGKIVFIDTPGHEAFYHMRERGTRITDIVVLVIAVDDGIKPQTVEAINYAKDANVPIVVALNKIDKADTSAALETVKRQLVQHGLVPEEWGGGVIVVPISAKTGQGVNELLEMIILQSQIMELKSDPIVPARAFVLESKIEKGLGAVATVICSEGTLKQGDYFSCGASSGKVRLLINSYGKRVSQAGPSTPVQVVGFDEFASVGDWLVVIPQEVYSKVRYEKSETYKPVDLSSRRSSLFVSESKEGEIRVLNLVIKADTRGSIDAILGCIQRLSKLSEKIQCPIRIILTGLGDITEGDVELSNYSKALILGFHVRSEKNASVLAKNSNVEIKLFEVIYHLMEYLEKKLESKRKIETVWKQAGEAVVKRVFDIKGAGIIAGCYMREGVLAKGDKVACIRAGKEIGSGKVVSLQREKKFIKEVHAGFECGFISEGFSDWQVNDVVFCYSEVKGNR